MAVVNFFSLAWINNYAQPLEARSDFFDLSPLRRWDESDLARPEGTPGFLFDCRLLGFKGKCPAGCQVGSASTFDGPFVGVVRNGKIVGSTCHEATLEAIPGTEETATKYLWHFVDLHAFLDFYAEKLNTLLGSNHRVAAFEQTAKNVKEDWPIPVS